MLIYYAQFFGHVQYVRMIPSENGSKVFDHVILDHRIGFALVVEHPDELDGIKVFFDRIVRLIQTILLGIFYQLLSKTRIGVYPESSSSYRLVRFRKPEPTILDQVRNHQGCTSTDPSPAVDENTAYKQMSRRRKSRFCLLQILPIG